MSPRPAPAIHPGRRAALMRALALAGLAGPALFTAAWLVAGEAEPGYSPLREDISALAAGLSPPALAVTTTIVVCGTGVAALAAGLGLHAPARAGRLIAGLLGLAGALMVAIAALPIACSEGRDPVCRARADAGLLPWQDAAHNVVAVSALALLLGALAVAVARPPALLTGRARAASAAALAATGLLAALYLGAPEVAWHGAVERLVVTVPLAWTSVVAARLWAAARQPAPATP